MKIIHKELAYGKWKDLTFVQRMANVGSEIHRSLVWRKKNLKYSEEARERALELLDLTIGEERNFFRLRELLRVREAMVDFFYGKNEYHFTSRFFEKYFYLFNYVAQINK